MLSELSRRETAANIKPDLDLDVYMKVRGSSSKFFIEQEFDGVRKLSE